MKKFKYIATLLSLVLLVFGCEDILERYPGDEMSDELFFSGASDFERYVNGLYAGIDRSIMRNRWEIENGSDNLMLRNTPASVLMRHSVSGEASNSSEVWNDGYANIREINFLLDNARKAKADDLIAQHYIGEAYYCRAFQYFRLLETFGGVPFIGRVLTTDDEVLYHPRESRDVIAERIIEDLDNAASRLFWKGEGPAVTGRINKETALLLKSRVGLFEGSWEYYHGRAASSFKVDGKDGSVFLDKAIEAVDLLMAHHGANVFVGRPGFEYEDLFNQQNYGNIPEAFFYKDYDASLGITHNGFKEMVIGGGLCPTKSAIDAYLMSDGKPEEISSVVYDPANQSSLLRGRDPRLAQTVYPPDRGGYVDLVGGFQVEQLWNVAYPDLNHSYSPNAGGYRIIKGTTFTTISLDINDLDDLIMRYSESLLNYAEAKAIRGTLTQDDIDKTINVLRSRVGMVPMNMAEVNGWTITYSENRGYDPSAQNVLNEIRRERRVELMFEGFRSTDNKHWALYREVFNGYKPKGANFQELFDYWSDEAMLLAAGLTPAQIASKKLVEGVNVARDGDYVRPFWRNADFTETGRGYYVNPERDYLEAIPKGEILHYQEKAGVTLTQNPGWF